jgi:hypothetical protein
MVITQFEVPSQYSTGRSEKAVKNFNQLGVLTNQLLQSGIFTRYFYDYEQKKKNRWGIYYACKTMYNFS